jgi:copper resistance protein B
MKKILKTTIISLTLNLSLFAGMADDPFLTKVMINNLEYQNSNEKAKSWDLSFWAGYDINKLYIYSEGEKPQKESSTSENQLVLSHAIAPFWDFQYGLGFDRYKSENKTWGIVSLAGLAPYFFETKISVLFGNSGEIGLRTNFEYDALITQKLILSPSIEGDLYTKDIQKMGKGKGLSSITAGLRLRYEIKREFAPYIGVEKIKTFSNTSKFNRINESYVTIGLRIFF